ncbi:MAG: transcriptional regulator [Burkholderiaceae bacterium]|nr:transcriptional regulator [Burkholderiaceae bacterium]
MGTESNNPFVLPGFGQSGDAAQNPLMASMDMMRRAWQGMAGATGMESAALATPMSVEDLERRISELRVVENWLRMNLTMLSSTIQGMEVQRSTISTLMSFAASAGSVAGAPGASTDTAAGPSPLEVVLGIKPGAWSGAASPSDTKASPAPEAANQQPSAAASAKAAIDEAAAAAQERADHAAQAATAYAASAETAVKGWWDMLQKQFDTLASATAATMQNAEAASGDTTLGKKATTKAPRKSTKATGTAGAAAKPAKSAKSVKTTKAASKSVPSVAKAIKTPNKVASRKAANVSAPAVAVSAAKAARTAKIAKSTTKAARKSMVGGKA